ncbi:MAG: hypothetical protein U0573_02740 [Phycisphaerales bacterium]|nr:hypothetical protein [Planctomycetota bacterium]
MSYRTAVVSALSIASAALAGPSVFHNIQDNGYFTPFNSSTSSSIRYGDSGWFGSGADAPVGLEAITLGLVVTNSSHAGTTDINFTFNDGDPSHLVFGTGAVLYSTTIHNVQLPDTSDIGGPAFFSLTIALPGVFTTGGFNNVGWSVGVSNFNSDGNLGFQCSSAFGQTAGYYTNNASFYNGSSWSLFSFGSGAYGVANFVADITVPAPHTFTIGLAGAALLARRRR